MRSQAYTVDTYMFNPFAVDSPPPDIPMPEVFQKVGAWSFTGSPYVSPALNAKAAGAAAVQFDPDVIVLPSPDKVQVFNTPPALKYIPLPPAPPPTESDPTGMQAMMEFLGFKKEFVAAGTAGINEQTASQNTVPRAPGPFPARTTPPGVQPGQAVQAPATPMQALNPQNQSLRHF